MPTWRLNRDRERERTRRSGGGRTCSRLAPDPARWHQFCRHGRHQMNQTFAAIAIGNVRFKKKGGVRFGAHTEM